MSPGRMTPRSVLRRFLRAQRAVDRGGLLFFVSFSAWSIRRSWSAFARQRESSGVLAVMVDPAPIVAPAPIRTGATSMLPEPMKAPSSMTVGHLLAPS